MSGRKLPVIHPHTPPTERRVLPRPPNPSDAGMSMSSGSNTGEMSCLIEAVQQLGSRFATLESTVSEMNNLLTETRNQLTETNNKIQEMENRLNNRLNGVERAIERLDIVFSPPSSTSHSV